jgi:hypothetical protein
MSDNNNYGSEHAVLTADDRSGGPPGGLALGAVGAASSAGAATVAVREDGSGTARSRRGGTSSWVPTWPLISTKLLELRKRRGLMIVMAVLSFGIPFLVLAIRLLFHAFDPSRYGPAGSPSGFASLANPMAEFGFIAGAVLGATAATTDLGAGVFRHLVITGRSRLALYLARIPSGLAILVPLVGVAFAGLCLVTAFAGTAQPKYVNYNGVNIPLNLDKAQLESWLLHHPGQAVYSIPFNGPPPQGIASVRSAVEHNISTIYTDYTADQLSQANPTANEMFKIGLWIELDMIIGFMVGLGLGSLLGQRTLTIVLLIVLEIIITPIMAHGVIPYFINGQRLFVGVAMDQLRPAGLVGPGGPGGQGGGRVLLGGRGVLGIPPMPTWAMVSVIVGWIAVWSGLGAWRMVRRDA